MIATEFDEIQRILNGRYKLCNSQDEAFRWYEGLKAFDFSVVKEAVNDWIVNDGWKPEVVNIAERCRDIMRWRQQSRVNLDPNEKTVGCTYCRDSGLIVTTTPTGIVQGRPCDKCFRGKKNYPWAFLSEKEKEDYNAKEIKAGRSVPKVHTAPEEFKKAYLYGDEKHV